jgi:hypothetical protein
LDRRRRWIYRLRHHDAAISKASFRRFADAPNVFEIAPHVEDRSRGA